MTTIKDIAQIANVSTTTVSRVINNYPDVSDKTRKKIKKIIQEKNYRPNSVARSLSTNKSNSIGIFFTDHFNSGLHHPFFREVIYGMEKSLGNKGYDIVYFTNRHWGEKFSYVEKCKDRNVDGVALMGVLKNDPNIKKLLNSNIPSVFVDVDISGNYSSYVISDNIEGSKKAINYLYDLGHRKIGMLMGIDTSKTSQDRLKGYKQALTELNLSFNKDWVFDGKYSEEGGYKAIKNMLKLRSYPTAIFCQSDGMAIGAMKAIEDSSLKITDDFSIIGFDDIEASRYVKPPLTTIAQNKEKMGSSVSKLLIKMIEEKKQNVDPIKLPVKLIKRESCSKI
ncbi:MAG: LacI family DNA-binding transcriptional regulator [Halanaerobiales bacterium]|nr:LacI family DNA-binding transcriptional regulator [Halanaerobiales bacterium]HKL43459.1 LacI family DNA-binding transcriptional regulator [Clostridia bacterium]